MRKIRFIQQPGMLIDLTTIYVLYFNQNLWFSINFSCPGKYEEDRKYYLDILSIFPEFSNDFLVFFYMIDEDRAFMTREMVYNITAKLSKKYSFSSMIERLSNTNFVVEKMLKFYFPHEYPMSFQDKHTVFSSIRNSDYPSVLKSALQKFFTEPDRFLASLIQDMKIRYKLISNYYALHYDKYIKFTQTFSYIDYWESVRQHPTIAFFPDETKPITVSFTLIKKYFSFWDTTFNFIMLGDGYKDFISAINMNKKYVDLVAVGKVFSEFSRVKILDYLSKTTEHTIYDISEIVQQSLSTTRSDLSSMLKIGLVKQRRIGEVTYYRLNTDFLDALCEDIELLKNGKYCIDLIKKGRDIDKTL